MESIRKLEETVAGWYKNVPHLPANVQKWIADNLWWLTAIVAVLGVLALFALIPLFMFAFGLSAVAGGSMMMGGYGYGYGVLGGLFWISVVLSLAASVVLTVLSAMAISPLKDHKKKGWDLLFLSEVLYFAFGAVGAVFSNVTGILSAVLGFLIGSYFLFEIRGYYGAKAKTVPEKKTEAKKA